jgi:hypothetical protein
LSRFCSCRQASKEREGLAGIHRQDLGDREAAISDIEDFPAEPRSQAFGTDGADIGQKLQIDPLLTQALARRAARRPPLALKLKWSGP